MRDVNMKMRFIWLVLFSIGTMHFVSCFAQRNEIWQRTYGIPGRFDIINCAKSTYDNGYILGLAATINSSNEYLTWVIKTDINGYVLWSKTLVNSGLFFL